MQLRGMLLDPTQEDLPDGGEADRFIRLARRQVPLSVMPHIRAARQGHHRPKPGREIENAREIAEAIAPQAARFIALATFVEIGRLLRFRDRG